MDARLRWGRGQGAVRMEIDVGRLLALRWVVHPRRRVPLHLLLVCGGGTAGGGFGCPGSSDVRGRGGGAQGQS